MVTSEEGDFLTSQLRLPRYIYQESQAEAVACCDLALEAIQSCSHHFLDEKQVAKAGLYI